MRVIYEQGDIVYNNNNNCFSIVLKELPDGAVRLLDISEDIMLNYPPKAALTYIGAIDLKNRLLDLVESVVVK